MGSFDFALRHIIRGANLRAYALGQDDNYIVNYTLKIIKSKALTYRAEYINIEICSKYGRRF